jgi:anhydro-N-acetylmuramic acid kinase
MNKKTTYAIGLMSGTSLDGLDLAYVKFTQDDGYDFEILAADTVNYSSQWRAQLQNAIQLNAVDLEKLDIEYGRFLGAQVNEFIQKHQITQLDFIASHGHTVFHQPDQGITKQIGDGQELANTVQHQIVCDFRTQDVALGGQGAPLVPIGDRLLFADYDACINLGGFANISFEQNNQRIAFDICPVNVVLNHFSKKLGFEYDDGGHLAKQGRPNLQVLEQLNQINFYEQTPPKSLGIEWVHEKIFPIVTQIDDPYEALRTFVEHVAIQIARSIEHCETVLFTGGGVFNAFLLERVEELSSSKIFLPSSEIINYKEALIFAFLGLLKLQNKVNCLSSVTGVKQDHASGQIFNPE